MPVPKRKTSKARRDKRSAGARKARGGAALCQTCKEPVAPHQVCILCGYYRGVKVERTKEERAQEREMAKRATTREASDVEPSSMPKVVNSSGPKTESK